MKYNLFKDVFNIALKKEKEPIQDQIEALSKKITSPDLIILLSLLLST